MTTVPCLQIPGCPAWDRISRRAGAPSGETQMLPVTLAFAAFAAFVAWGRGKKAPIAAR
jgi:hypothetical protein